MIKKAPHPEKIEENEKLKCPYCSQWFGIMANLNTMTIICNNCGEKLVLEINVIKPLLANISIEENEK